MSFLIQQTLIYAVPLMIVALAGVFAERSGIINLALEGIMIFGAFIGVLFVRQMQGLEVFNRGLGHAAGPRAAGHARVGGYGRAVFAVAVVRVDQPARRPDHRRHGAQPAGARAGAVLHPHHRQPEHPQHGQR